MTRRAGDLEAPIVHAIRLDLGACTDLDLERRTVGRFEAYDERTGKGRFVTVGVVGEADLQGILGPLGRFFALEVKVPGEKSTPAQLEWAARKRMYGGFVAEVHSVAEGRAAYCRAKEGASE